VTLTSWGELVLVASAKSGIKSAQELIERARARPRGLNYGSPGAGTPRSSTRCCPTCRRCAS